MDNLLQIVTGIINGDEYAAGFFIWKSNTVYYKLGQLLETAMFV